MLVKICGLTNLEDARTAWEAGADFLGVVLEPSSPRYVRPDDRFLVDLLDLAGDRVRAVFGPWIPTTVLPAGYTVQSFAPGPGAPFWQAIRVQRAFDESLIHQDADRIVLDAFSTEGYGGTGHRVDIDLARSWIEARPGQVVLAGGLTPENVGEIVKSTEPWAVDVSSGVEREPGRKDPGKVRAFIAAAKA